MTAPASPPYCLPDVLVSCHRSSSCLLPSPLPLSLQDLQSSLDSLEGGLRHHLRVMSSFDKFRQEVASGRLDWTPVHRDPAFWRENLASFEDNAFQVGAMWHLLPACLPAGPHGRLLAYPDGRLAAWLPGWARGCEGEKASFVLMFAH